MLFSTDLHFTPNLYWFVGKKYKTQLFKETIELCILSRIFKN